MAVGQVKYFDARQGYGYIVPEDAPSDSVYVSADEIVDAEPLEVGQWVRYEYSECDRSEATGVRDAELAQVSSTVSA